MQIQFQFYYFYHLILFSRSRDEMEKEIERQYRAKQLSESLSAHQQRFDEVTKRLEEEEKAR